MLKIGDNVKIIKNLSGIKYLDLYVGQIGVITDISSWEDSSLYQVDNIYWWTKKELEKGKLIWFRE